MLIRLLGINFGEISIEIHTLLFKKMRLKIYFTKWRPFCLGLDVLIGSGSHQHHQTGDLWKASLFSSIKSNFVCIKVVAVVNWKPIYFVIFIFQTWLLCRVTHWNGNDKMITWWRHQMETFSALLAICVNSPHKGQWRGALMFSLICVWINGWINNREAGDLRRNRAHYDVTVMRSGCSRWWQTNRWNELFVVMKHMRSVVLSFRYISWLFVTGVLQFHSNFKLWVYCTCRPQNRCHMSSKYDMVNETKWLSLHWNGKCVCQ